jgi:hypothetical protein
MRGLSEKMARIYFHWDYFFEENPVDRVHVSVDDPWLDPPWTIHGRAARARRNLASRCSGAQVHQPRGGGRGDGVGEPVKGLTGGWVVARWPGDGGEWVVTIGVPVRGSLELRERRRRERGGAVLSRGSPGGFYRAGEGAPAPGDGG